MARRPFDLLLFDFDGTLSASIDGITACMGAAMARFGYPAPSPAAVARTVGLTLEESIARLIDADPATRQEIGRTYRALHDHEAAPRAALFDGAAEFLAAAAAANIACVLVSNKGSAGLEQLLAQFGIRHAFDLVLAANQVSAQKPEAALFDRHIAPIYTDVQRLRMLVVGDTEVDLHFAANIGAPACWAEYGYGDKAACAALTPAYRITSMRELAGICGL